MVLFLLEEKAPHNDRPEAWQEPIVGRACFLSEPWCQVLCVWLLSGGWKLVDGGQTTLRLIVFQSRERLASSVDALEVLVQRLHL